MGWKAKAIIALLATAAVVAPTGAASADDSVLPASFVQEVTTVWTDNGLSAQLQASLLEKLSAGQALDANTGAEPVSSETSTVDGYIRTVSTYADGSISVASVETPAAASVASTSASTRFVAPEGLVSPMSVSNCSSKSSPAPGAMTWNHCTAYGWFTGVDLAFIFSGTAIAAGGTHIDSYNTPVANCAFPLSCESPKFTMIKKTQSGSTAAHLELSTQYNGAGSGTTYLHLFGKDNSFYTN